MSAVRSAPVPLTAKSVEPDDVSFLPLSVCVSEGPSQLVWLLAVMAMTDKAKIVCLEIPIISPRYYLIFNTINSK